MKTRKKAPFVYSFKTDSGEIKRRKMPRCEYEELEECLLCRQFMKRAMNNGDDPRDAKVKELYTRGSTEDIQRASQDPSILCKHHRDRIASILKKLQQAEDDDVLVVGWQNKAPIAIPKSTLDRLRHCPVCKDIVPTAIEAGEDPRNPAVKDRYGPQPNFGPGLYDLTGYCDYHLPTEETFRDHMTLFNEDGAPTFSIPKSEFQEMQQCRECNRFMNEAIYKGQDPRLDATKHEYCWFSDAPAEISELDMDTYCDFHRTRAQRAIRHQKRVDDLIDTYTDQGSRFRSIETRNVAKALEHRYSGEVAELGVYLSN